MITPAPLFTLTFVSYCLPLALSWRLTPLTIDEHPCKPEKLKFQNRYICDSEGNVECLTGWKSKGYNVDKHFPCSEPICDPLCINGECKLPNVCSCDIGWDGLDCGTCIAMPGCVNGGCVNSETSESEPFTCFCEEGWKGALCDLPDCPDHCNNRGKCVVTAGGEHQCNCDLGWTGDTCETCMANVGCNTTNTETGLGCQFTNMAQELEDVPNSCQCKEEWTGPFCELPNCVDESGDQIECVHGVCTAGGIDSTSGDPIPPFCQCTVGWEAYDCNECVPHPDCPNDGSNQGDIAACINPWECRCQGSEADATADNDFKFCTEFIATGTCAADDDCPEDTPACDDDGSCLECLTDEHCCTEELPFCKSDSNSCVACLTDDHCQDEGLVCKTDTDECVECTADDGQTDSNCPADKPVCSSNICQA